MNRGAKRGNGQNSIKESERERERERREREEEREREREREGGRRVRQEVVEGKKHLYFLKEKRFKACSFVSNLPLNSLLAFTFVGYLVSVMFLISL